MNKQNDNIEKNSGNFRKIFFIILIIIFVISEVVVAIYFLNNNANKDLEEKILNQIEVDESKVTDDKTEKMLKLEELQKQNSDIIGWLSIDGTEINYLVLKTDDNKFYLDHDYLKKKSAGGSLFLDKDFDLNKTSSNYLIYGHRMKNGTMFEDLIKYKDEAFYNNHKTIEFTTNKVDKKYEIISAFYSRVYLKSEKNVFRYYYFIDAKNEDDYNDYVKSCKKSSLYDTGKTAQYGDQLITLSTCSYHTEDGRVAVVARKIKK